MHEWPVDVIGQLALDARKRANAAAAEVFAELTEKCDVSVGDEGTVVRCSVDSGVSIQADDGPLVYTENPTASRLAALAETAAWAHIGSGMPPPPATGDQDHLPAATRWTETELREAAADAVTAFEAAADPAVACRVTVQLRIRRRSWHFARTDSPPAAGLREGAVLTVRCTDHRGQVGSASTSCLGWRGAGWDPGQAGLEAANMLVHRQQSRPMPAAEIPIIFGAGGGGAFLHEICGHGLEADCLGDGSVLAAVRGQRIAPAGVTVVDSGRPGAGWGSFEVDDEGTPARETVLIEDGVLVGALSTRRTAHWTADASTGNARRASFRCAALPRMSNTYMLPGPDRGTDIIANTPAGLYVRALSTGQVSPSTGKFTFGVDAGFVIADGRLAEPVSGVVIHGDCLKALSGIDGIGDDLSYHAATCRKDGQHVPVGYGLPTLRVTGLTVAAGR